MVRAAFLAGGLFALGACSLLVSVDGLSGGGAAGSDGGSDAGADAVPAVDAADAAPATDGAAQDATDAGLTYASVVLADHPLAYYRLDETSTAGAATAADSTGNGNDGQYVGGVTLGAPGAIATSANGGVSDTAASLAGAGYVDCGDRFAFAGNVPYSLEAWVQAARNSNYQAICGRLDRLTDGTPENGYYFELVPAGQPDGISMSMQTSGQGTAAVAPFPSTTWVHVVGVYDGNEVLVYTNGASAGSGPALSITGATDHFRIGIDTLSYAPLTGTLDEVAVYDYALQPARIAEHYKVGMGLGP